MRELWIRMLQAELITALTRLIMRDSSANARSNLASNPQYALMRDWPLPTARL